MSTVPPDPPPSEPVRPQPRNEMFAPRTPERAERSWLPWGIAGAVVVVAIIVAFMLTRHSSGPPANTVLPNAPYAKNLAISGVQMSESTSLSGGKSTYLDGHIRNSGSATVTAATVQVLFGNDEAMPPQVETLPLSLIRTREPYVDIEPVSAAPIGPGEDREFRLIFEDVTATWNQQTPEIHVVQVATR